MLEITLAKFIFLGYYTEVVNTVRFSALEIQDQQKFYEQSLNLQILLRFGTLANNPLYGIVLVKSL